MDWLDIACLPLLAGDYFRVAALYEDAIAREPNTASHYWYLGLAYLLQGLEEEAQGAWMAGMAEGDWASLDRANQELAEILATEARRQTAIAQWEAASLIRLYLRELMPEDLPNLLALLELNLKLGNFEPKSLEEWQFCQVIGQFSGKEFASDRLLELLARVLEFPSRESVALTRTCFEIGIDPDTIIAAIMPVAISFIYDRQMPSYSADLIQICLTFRPDHPYLINDLLSCLSMSKKHEEALSTARQLHQLLDCNDWALPMRLYGTYRLLLTLLGMGAWLEASPIIDRYRVLLGDLVGSPPQSLDDLLRGRFLSLAMPIAYLQDSLAENRAYTNAIARTFYHNFDPVSSSPDKTTKKGFQSKAKQKAAKKSLNIGYIAHTLRRHSVGWLSRWLFRYHDRDRFHITLYLLNQPEDDLTADWFIAAAHQTRRCTRDPQAIASQIRKDGIDILIDLDSLTLNLTYQVMALKPAPIQVTWLGLDGSGLPTIDYFIADPYVLPADAGAHYQEKIWCLPQTYLAVGGFEVGDRTLHRADLDIAEDAVIYFSVQNGLKRHPDSIRWQMQILKAVENSTFLIKGAGSEAKIRDLFGQLAIEAGVDPDRLRFLGSDPDELTHRANLAIADIVLDTYPYNGATTTLEVLWMSIPLVTLAGQQFAARNSYAFMINAGIQEGIAHSPEEYIEWGIHLGRDRALRQQVAETLRASRTTAPLWQVPAFAREMETAYREMYEEFRNVRGRRSLPAGG